MNDRIFFKNKNVPNWNERNKEINEARDNARTQIKINLDAMGELLKEALQTAHKWHRIAYILANKYGLCEPHDKRGGYYKDRKWKLDEYLELVECLDCQDNPEKRAEADEYLKKIKNER